MPSCRGPRLAHPAGAGLDAHVPASEIQAARWRLSVGGRLGRWGRRRGVSLVTRHVGTALRQRHPGYADVAVQEGLASHPVTGPELLFGQMFALFGLNGIRVLQTLLDLAFAGAA